MGTAIPLFDTTTKFLDARNPLLAMVIKFIKVESYFFMSEKSTYIILGILFLLPFSILGGIIISWNLISSNKIIFIPF